MENLEKDVEGLTAELAARAAERQPRKATPIATPEVAALAAPTVTVAVPAPAPAPAARSPVALPDVPPIVRIVRDFFSGGNALVRIGIIVLLFGVGFLLRYLSEHTRVPIQFRLSGIAVAALVLLTLGWRLRMRRRGYGLALQGGAVGVLYLVVFAAMHLYALLSPAAAFPLLVVLSALTAMLAILENSQAFVLLAIAGGFLAPLLASNGQGDHVVLFTYYAVINALIVVIAWFKSWRALNVAGFLFTFVIATAWGVLRYRPENFASTEPFLLLSYLLPADWCPVLAQAAAESAGLSRCHPDLRQSDCSVGLQSAMLHQQLLPLAFSSLAVSALYLTFAWSLHRSARLAQRPLVEAFLALGVAFLTLAVPLAFSGSWYSASWAVEGAALVWIGCRQNRLLARVAGVLLQVAAGLTVWLSVSSCRGTSSCRGSVFERTHGRGGLVCSAHAPQPAVEPARERTSYRGGPVFLGVIFWLLSGMIELRHRCPAPISRMSSCASWRSARCSRAG